MVVPRIYIGSDRVTVSKTGFDAVNPPAVDYKYLSLDTRLNQGRPLEVGLFPNVVLNGVSPYSRFYYSRAYPTPPGVDLIFFGLDSTGFAGIGAPIVTRDAQASNTVQRSSYVIVPYTDGFLVGENWAYRHSSLFNGQPHNVFYIAWQVR